MIFYGLRFFWVASSRYRLRPWQSPYLRWRIETYSGIPADQITRQLFWSFVWKERRAIGRFLQWGADMKRLENRLRRQSLNSIASDRAAPAKAL
ncbi:MAG: hypothetical protein HY648_13100 [Acidobacteria bacterium]|nr:hypothetical protein [Acidobacteriota bacterium]